MEEQFQIPKPTGLAGLDREKKLLKKASKGRNGPDWTSATSPIWSGGGKVEGVVGPKHALQLLIVDDDLPVLKACCEIAAGMGFSVSAANNAAEAQRYIQTQSVDVILMDLRMPGGGLPLLEEIRRRRPRTAVVIMTAFATVSSAVEAMRMGATDYLTKPFAMDELTSVLERAGERRSLELESHRAVGQLRVQAGFGALAGVSPEMEKLHRMVAKVATATHPVLILGESGAGKETTARSIHASGQYASRRFAVLECGQLAPSVLESELFGDAREGDVAFGRTRPALLSSPDGGTLFLDGISELPLTTQARLMRALQDRSFAASGTAKTVPVTVRLLAGSSRNLASLVEAGLFRRDLYYRLNVVTLRIPPLRERREDVPLLAEYFLERMRRESAVPYEFEPEAMGRMMAYDWPGNVRELESVVERACSLSSGPLLYIGDLPTQMHGGLPPEYDATLRVDERDPEEHNGPSSAQAPPIVSIAELEKEAIINTIRQLQGDKLMAAKLLGIGKTTLYRKLKEYGITEM